MLKFVRAVSAVALIAGMPATSLAQTSSTQQTAAPSKGETDYLNEVICQKQEVTGSRLTKKRICKTRAQWADQQLQDRQEIERVQTQRGMKDQ